MKKSLRNLLAGLAALFFTCISHQASATHAAGTEITYSCVSPGTYVVFLKVYRECNGSPYANLNTLSILAPGCNTGRTISLTQVGSIQAGDPFCFSLTGGCTTAGLANYEQAVYSGTVTFSATEQTCSDWVFSWSECCRANVTNLVAQPPTQNMYAEARLKLAPGINNNSAQFGPLSSLYVSYGQPTRFSSFAYDPDGDSLVYSLQNPLSAINTPVNYGSYSTMVIYNADSSKYSPLTGGTFSNAFPIISHTIDWSQPMPLFPVKTFGFNTRTGSMLFTPSRFVRNVSVYAPENKYAMVVQVDEYRKINGVATKVGTVRRDFFVSVIDPAGNRLPDLTGITANGQSISDNDIINLRPGTPLNLQFAATDANLTDAVALTTDANTVLPGAVFSKTTASQPTATITWTPTVSDVRDQVYYFRVHAKDNACPVKGFQTYTFGVKVSATGGVTGLSEMQNSASGFTAFPNPFSDELTFKLNLKTKAESIVIYNLLGQRVDQISLKTVGLGAQKVQWENAHNYAAGTYVARLVSDDKTVQTLKFTKLQ